MKVKHLQILNISQDLNILQKTFYKHETLHEN